MKKVYRCITDFLLILIFSVGVAFNFYKEFINISLLLNSQEINAKVEDVKYTRNKRTHYCTVFFEFENEGIQYRNSVEFNWTLIDRISNSIIREYKNGDQIIIAFDDYGNFQVKNRIKKELFIYLFYFLMNVALLSFAVFSFISNLQIKSKVSIYLQDNNYKFKEIKKLESITSYINMLKRNEIICFGMGSNKDFIEYSYTGKEFVERKSNNSKESEKIISDEFEVEKLIKKKLKEIERKTKQG